jgi:VanZ family protein
MVTAAALTFGYFRFPSVAMIATLLPIYAALLEIVQMWVPGRMSRLIDVAAGAAGSWIGIGLILLLHWLAAIPTAPSLEPRHRPQDAE